MKRRVLLADNDPLALQTVRTVATGFGAEVLEAGSVDEAYRAFIEKGPDLVVADALLPKRGAFELFRRIRQSVGGEGVAFLVSSAMKGMSDLREEALGTWNALEVLDKPLFEAELSREFARVLSKPGSEGAPSNILWGYVGDEGGFDRDTFPLVVAHAMRHKELCGLAVWSGKTKKLLSFSGGALTFAHSNRFAETLGRHLLARGVVTEQGYDAAVQMAVNSKIRIGEAFVKLGQADMDTIETHVRRNILDKVAETFTWQSGYYRFVPYQAPPATIPGGPIGCESILWMLVCEQLSSRLVIDSMRSQEDVRLTLERKGEKLPGRDILGSMASEIPRLLAQCDGRSLKSVMETVEEKFFKPIYFLILCGFLAPDVADEQKAQPSKSVDDKAVEQTEELLEWLQGRNFFQLFDVAIDCDDNDVKRAYQRCCDDYGVGDERGTASVRMTKAIHGIRDLLDRAELALSGSQARSNYFASLEGEELRAGESLEEVAAEAAFREGQGFLRQRLWMSAYDKFTKAADLNPAEPEYILYRGIALMRDDSGSDKKDHKEAEQILWEAHRAMPQSAEPIYQLGILALKLGNEVVARELFEKALKHEPGHERSRRKLAAINGGGDREGLGKKLGTIFKR
jgi:CheY-like chemotaxis protein